MLWVQLHDLDLESKIENGVGKKARKIFRGIFYRLQNPQLPSCNRAKCSVEHYSLVQYIIVEFSTVYYSIALYSIV